MSDGKEEEGNSGTTKPNENKSPTSSEKENMEDIMMKTDFDMSWFTKPEMVKDWMCAICQNVLSYAVITKCGHLFCSRCLEQSIQQKPKCPECRGDLHNAWQSAPWFDRKIQDQEVHCIHDTCEWIGKHAELGYHRTHCPNQPLSCDDCGHYYQRMQSEKHQECCPQRPETCLFCQERIKKDGVVGHRTSCFYRPIQCPLKCDISRLLFSEMFVHLDQFCQNRILNCRFSNIGCPISGTEQELIEHCCRSPIGLAIHQHLLLEQAISSDDFVSTSSTSNSSTSTSSATTTLTLPSTGLGFRSLHQHETQRAVRRAVLGPQYSPEPRVLVSPSQGPLPILIMPPPLFDSPLSGSSVSSTSSTSSTSSASPSSAMPAPPPRNEVGSGKRKAQDQDLQHLLESWIVGREVPRIKRIKSQREDTKHSGEWCQRIEVEDKFRKSLKLNDLIDAHDGTDWYLSRVIIDDPNSVRVHFLGWDSDWDRTFARDSRQIARPRRHSGPYEHRLLRLGKIPKEEEILPYLDKIDPTPSYWTCCGSKRKDSHCVLPYAPRFITHSSSVSSLSTAHNPIVIV